MKTKHKLVNPREIRQRLGLNQQEFWGKIGVTQSGGSRYEGGRDMPRPVRELLRLIYIEELDLSQVCREDIELIEYLKAERDDLYKELKKSARSAQKQVKGSA